MSVTGISPALAEGPVKCDESGSLINELFNRGITNVVVLMRHSAREFEPGRHDLENPLTERGRNLAARLGQKLDPSIRMRTYTSPPERCVETAQLIREQHAANGGAGQSPRVVEGLGLFYILDQIRMWKGMSENSDGMDGYLQRWFDDELALDEMISAQVAAKIILRLLVGKLSQQGSQPGMDICVSHDTSLLVLREKIQQLTLREYGAIEFLDVMALYRTGERFYIASRWGDAREIDPAMLQ